MKNKLIGLLAILFPISVMIMADIILFSVSVWLGIIYALMLPASFLVLFNFYCRKCPHARDSTCIHVFPGIITSKIFSTVNPAPYSKKEISCLVPLGILALLPQYWLIQKLPFFIIFWAVMGISFIVIRISLCRLCRNINCPLNPEHKKASVFSDRK